MDFFIIANAWSAGKDNPTSKHRIALELVRQGHRVLWIEGSGMRTPSVGSASDRLRMVRKVAAALRGARREEQLLGCQVDKLLSERPEGSLSSTTEQPNNLTTSLHVLAPLFVPLPKFKAIRFLNGLICRWTMRFWGWRLGFRDPVLINYVPVLAEAMRGRRQQTSGIKKPCEAQVAADVPAAESQNGQKIVRRDAERHPDEASPLAPRVVYHCVDRWDAFAMYDSSLMGEMDRRCCQYADLVIASAGELYDRCRAINPNTVLIPHGVDWEHFRCAATEVQTIDQNAGSARLKSNVYGLGSMGSSPRTIGFFGLLSEWVDQELILRLAKEFSPHDTPHLNPLPQGERKDGNQLHPRHLHPLHLHPLPLRERAGVRGEIDVPLRERAGVRGSSSPHARILLIGKADVDVSRLQGIPNIELSGPIPFAELPAHVATFTVGIIPFVVNDLTRSVNPIKFREMLSAGCPVVSTNLPEVARYAEGGTPHTTPLPQGVRGIMDVQIAHTHDEFVAMVKTILENPLSPADRLALSDAMAGETWSAKVREILALLGQP